MLKDLSSKAGLAWLVFFLVIIVASRLTTLGVAAWNMDEGVTAAIADSILAGGIPYLDTVDHRGPATYYAYAAWFSLVGEDGLLRMQSLQVALLLLVSALAVVTYALGRAIGGNRIAVLSVFWLVLVTSNGWTGDTRAFHTEWLLALGSASGMLLVFWSLQRRSWGGLFLGGVALGFAFITKQPALFDLAAVSLLIVLQVGWPLPGSRWAGADGHIILPFAALAALLSGFLIVPASFGIYLYSQGAWGDFLTWFWHYNVDFYVPAVSGSARLQAALLPWANQMLAEQWLSFVPAAAGLLLGIAYLAQSGRKGLEWFRQADVVARNRMFVIVWLLAGWVAANLSGREFGHYLIQLFVPLALVSGIVLNEAVRKLASLQASKADTSTQPGLHTAPRTLLFLLAFILLFAVKPFAIKPPGGWPQLAYLDMPATMPMDLANHIKSQTSPDDRIWVWGWMGSIYVLAERLPASRFVYCSFLSGLIPWVNAEEEPPLATEFPGAWEMWSQDVQQNPPVYIVDMAVGDRHFWSRYGIEHYPLLQSFIAENYNEEGVFYVEDADGGNSAPYFRLYRHKGK